MIHRPLISVLALALAWSVFATGSASAAKPQTLSSTDKKGKTHYVKGYVPMKAAPNAKKFKAPAKLAATELPPQVDLRGKLTAVEDQGETSSCVANAMAGAYEYWIKRVTEQDYDTSRMFIYYNARWRNGDQDEDGGSIIQLAMEGLKEFGSCPEPEWPFEKELLFTKPNRTAYQAASETKIKEMQQVPLELEAWKQSLASGLPVVFGCLLFESFDECNQNGGVVPMPDPQELSRESHGGHAMCAVGYSDREKVFIVRNSWGDQWGDEGYCYMPYNYLMSPELNGGDCWVFIPETPIENPEDTWFPDDKPVTDGGRGVDFEINPYDATDYADVEITWWEDETEEYNDEPDEDYVQYVEYVEEEEWDEIPDYTVEEAIEGVDDEEYVDEGAGEEDEDEAYAEDEEYSDDDAEEESDDEEYAEDEESDDEEYSDDEEVSDEEEDGEYNDDEEYSEDDEAYDEDEDDGEYSDEDDGEYSDEDDEESSDDDEEYEDEDSGDDEGYEEDDDGGGDDDGDDE